MSVAVAFTFLTVIIACSESLSPSGRFLGKAELRPFVELSDRRFDPAWPIEAISLGDIDADGFTDVLIRARCAEGELDTGRPGEVLTWIVSRAEVGRDVRLRRLTGLEGLVRNGTLSRQAVDQVVGDVTPYWIGADGEGAHVVYSDSGQLVWVRVLDAGDVSSYRPHVNFSANLGDPGLLGFSPLAAGPPSSGSGAPDLLGHVGTMTPRGTLEDFRPAVCIVDGALADEVRVVPFAFGAGEYFSSKARWLDLVGLGRDASGATHVVVLAWQSRPDFDSGTYSLVSLAYDDQANVLREEVLIEDLVDHLEISHPSIVWIEFESGASRHFLDGNDVYLRVYNNPPAYRCGEYGECSSVQLARLALKKTHDGLSCTLEASANLTAAGVGEPVHLSRIGGGARSTSRESVEFLATPFFPIHRSLLSNQPRGVRRVESVIISR